MNGDPSSLAAAWEQINDLKDKLSDLTAQVGPTIRALDQIRIKNVEDAQVRMETKLDKIKGRQSVAIWVSAVSVILLLLNFAAEASHFLH